MSLPATINPATLWDTNNANQINWNSTPTAVSLQDTNAANYSFGVSLVSIKQVGGNTSSAYTYTLAWASQVNSKTKPATGAYLQQWFSPMWNVSAASGFTNYICTSAITQGSSSTSFKTTNTSSDLSVSTMDKNQSNTIIGTTVTNGDFVVVDGLTSMVADDNGWYTNSCQGYRSDQDTNTDLSAFTVGTSVKYTAGYKYLPTSTGTAPISQFSSTGAILSYVILDSAVALTMSAAAAAAVSALAF